MDHSTNPNPVQLWWCNGGVNQQWTRPKGAFGKTTDLLTIFMQISAWIFQVELPTSNFAIVNLWKCNYMNVNQQWKYVEIVKRINLNGLPTWCPDATTRTAGMKARIWGCDVHLPSQKWTMVSKKGNNDRYGNAIQYFVMDPCLLKVCTRFVEVVVLGCIGIRKDIE